MTTHSQQIDWKADAPASIVVFLVALPLCLGIALASGAPLFAGVIAGVVGGLIVAPISGSALMVSGPAAGLTAIVLAAITDLGDYRAFLLAVVLGGLIQLLLAAVRAGIIGYYFPSSVIKGMLSAIGIVLILKQFPHAVGYDTDAMGNESFQQGGDATTFSAVADAFGEIGGEAAVFLVDGAPRPERGGGLGLGGVPAERAQEDLVDELAVVPDLGGERSQLVLPVVDRAGDGGAAE